METFSRISKDLLTRLSYAYSNVGDKKDLVEVDKAVRQVIEDFNDNCKLYTIDVQYVGRTYMPYIKAALTTEGRYDGKRHIFIVKLYYDGLVSIQVDGEDELTFPVVGKNDTSVEDVSPYSIQALMNLRVSELKQLIDNIQDVKRSLSCVSK